MNGLLRDFGGVVREPYAVYLSLTDPRVSKRRRILVITFVVLLIVYIINPFDLIPEYLPVGLIDDLAAIPLVTYLAQSLIPREVIRESRAEARDRLMPTRG